LIKDEPQTSEPPKIKGKIEFRNLTFGYNGKPVLSDINLTIEAGRNRRFRRKNRQRKINARRARPRLLDAPEGTVLIDDRPIRRFPLAQLRRSIGFVPQETFLFSDTLAQNIAFGVEDGTITNYELRITR
jgi:ATP-binding cassette subfamily B multidrug efflux pump